MADDDVRVPAGWYPDPLGLPQLRWWDNHAWTEHTSDARQPMVAEAMTAQPSFAQPRQTAPATRLAFADDLPFADDLADPANLAYPLHDLDSDVSLPSRRTLREAERLVPDDDTVRDLTGDASGFADPLPELEAPFLGSQIDAEPSPAVRYARAAGIADAPRSMRYDLAESHEDLLGEASVPRSAFDHASSSTTTFIPDYPTEAKPEPETFRAHGSHRARLAHAPRISTVPGWLLPLLPLYMLLVGMMVLLSGVDASFAPITAALILGVPWLASIILAIIDRRMLLAGGMESPAHWAWAILGAPVYLIARLVATVREAGTGFGPVLTFFTLGIFMVGAVVAVPGLVMGLLPESFSLEAERSVVADARSLGMDLQIDCPTTPPMLVQQSFTCQGTNNDGDTYDVVVSLQRANGWIDWRVDSWGVFTMGS
ncbi:MAG: DUF2510 domain-containing protein [Pseudolysinimonas sp.]|uniref:DUF2510 domain-containing protein n=1 Tax=Pseudolysinimonas sp. TaxID=2680009 RepID=UPI003C7954F8